MGHLHNRRAAMMGAAISVAALVAPVAAAVTDPEPVDPDAAIQHHAWKLASALARRHGGMWSFDLFIDKSPDNKVILFKREQDTPNGAIMLFK